jgi:Tfp pilus assembly protein PilV
MPTEHARGRSARARRGVTLVEVMIAMTVTMVGAMGLSGLNTLGLRYIGDGRRMTRATAIAEDLANQITTWGFADPRLANSNTTNDDDPGDVGFVFERTANVSGLVDHAEADLGGTWQGIPAADLAVSGFERYWNVSFNDPSTPGALLDSNLDGVPDAMRITVIVRWPQGTGWRRIVLFLTKPNPNSI